MIVVSISGSITSDIRESETVSGVKRATFTIQSEDEGSLPLRYEAVAFGKVGARAVIELQQGTAISCYGRLSAGGPEKKISLVVSGFEVFEGAQTNGN